MKKILIIDDTSDGLSKLNLILKDEKLVELTSNVNDIFNVQTQKPVLNDKYEFVFLHQSFKSKNEIPSDIVAVIKDFVSDTLTYRLVRFTGGTRNTEGLIDDNQIDTYMTRKLLEQNIQKFVDFSKQINEWYLPALLINNHLNYFLENAYSNLNSNYNLDMVKKCLIIMGYDSNLNNDISKDKLLKLIETKINE